MTGERQVAILRFEGHYNYWPMLMKFFLKSNELFYMVEIRL